MKLIKKFLPILTIFYFSEAFSSTKKLEINKLIEEPTKTYNINQDLESLGLDNVERQNKILMKNGNIEDEYKKANEMMKKQLLEFDEKLAPPEAREYIKKIKEDFQKSNTQNAEVLPKKPNNEVEFVANKEPKKEVEMVTSKEQNIKDKNAKKPIISNSNSEIKNSVNAVKKPKNNVIKKSKSNKISSAIQDVEEKNFKNETKQEEQQKEQEFQKKLNESRRLYLNDLIDNDDKSEEEILENDNVIPIKKSLTPFAQDELPAIPILSRSRSEDNYHIPFIYTPKEYIDILFSAISMGSVSYFNEAFKYVLNPNISNDQGDTVLTYAIFLRKYSIIASVLAKGADPNLPNRLGYNPVHLAIEMNDFTSLDLLEKNNADMFYIDVFGRTYLMLAAKNGFLPAVDLLVKKGVNINEMDNDGFTALSIAYRNKHELVVKYLLKNGAKTWVEKEFVPQKRNFIKELQNRWK